MIYLIGTKHEFQHNGHGSVNENSRKKFIFYLENAIKKYSINLIAEEFNKEALQKSNATVDTVKCVTDKLKIRHVFCEMTIKERKENNIPTDKEICMLLFSRAHYFSSEEDIFNKEKQKYFLKRETFWFEKISNYLDRNIIFVCGATHIRSFETLLTGKGYKPVILIKQWY